MPDPSPERIAEVVAYDPQTGAITYRSGRGRGGSRTKDGYLQVRIGRRVFLAHRVAWVCAHGAWPTNQIDHRNGQRDDNRLSNLREATQAENNQNQTAHAGTASGEIGVTWHKRDRRWQAQIRIDGRLHYLGQYLNRDEAVLAYAKAKADLHPFQPSVRASVG